MTLIASPLRYPGGKARLFPFVADLIIRNSLYNSCYREPYAGGAGLALNLLFGGFCKSIGLNDIDISIYSFWRSVLHYNEEFCDLVAHAPLNIDEWYRQKEIWQNPHDASELSLGFATYYLNRTNRSGIIEGAGPIGGYQQLGNYKIDARFNRDAQITLLRYIGSARDVIEVSDDDASDYLARHLTGDDLLYLDPPYYVRGRKLYRNFYDHADHALIANIMRHTAGNWIVSYDDTPPIRELYSWSTPIELRLRYTAGTSAIGDEVLYIGPALHSPNLEALAA
jgi:DNA adenine methylase